MKRTWKLCLWSSLIAAGVSAQDGASAVISRLNTALTSKNTTEVRALEQKLLSMPASMSTLLEAGVALAQHDQMPDAEAIFEHCSQQYPASFEAKYNLALARIALAEYPPALEALNAISPLTADEKAAVEYLTGKILLATNHLREARKSLAAAYTRHPEEENYALDLALVYIRSSAYLQATEVLQSSLAAHPGSLDLALEMAVTDVLAGRYADGTTICRKLQEQDPALAITRLIAAFSYCARKEYQACENESSAGLASPRPYPYLYYLRARAGWDSGSTDRVHMLDDVSKALQQMPKCSVCFVLRSRLFEASHNDASAIADLRQAVAADPQADSAWYRLFLLYRKAQRPAEAADALKHCRSIHDDGLNQEIESFREQFLNGVSSKPLSNTQ